MQKVESEAAHRTQLLRRLLLVGGTSVFSYGVLYLVLGRPAPAVVEWVYLIIVLISLALLRLEPRLTDTLLKIHMAAVFTVTTAVTASLGGLVDSGVFMVWGVITPMAAIIFLGWPASSAAPTRR